MASILEELVLDVGSYLMKVDMFPVFFIAHFVIACVIVREDSKDLGPKFRQNHPFATWLCTLITGLSGVFVHNFLFGDPLVDILQENKIIIFLTVIWYLMNYFPYDVPYKVAKFKPVFLIAAVLQECLRVRFIYGGLQLAAKVYPNANLIILLGGIIKGNGYGFIKIVERLVRGKWTPSTNEILDITYFAKSGTYASILFLLHHIKLLPVPVEILYAGIIAVFVICRLAIHVQGITDPLLPLESPICTLLFGSDSHQAWSKKIGAETESTNKKYK